VIDLRGADEVSVMPALAPDWIDYHAAPISATKEVAPPVLLSEAETVVHISHAYRGIVRSERATIARIFGLLAEPHAIPALICCTAGKDRTGIVSAFILLAIEVERHRVDSDYAETNNALGDVQRKIILDMAAKVGTFAMPEGGAAAAMLRADPAYLAAALEEAGDIRAYLAAAGVTQGTLESVARNLLG
jgi:protein-tyrosine phosphatase